METKKPAGSAELFPMLIQKLKQAPEWNIRVTNHIREVGGHNTLPAYHNNGATEEEKMEMYKFLLRAILAKDPSVLRGAVANGQAAAEATYAETPFGSDTPKVAEPVKTEPRKEAPAKDGDDDLVKTIADLIHKRRNSGIDEKRVIELADQSARSAVCELEVGINKVVTERLGELRNSIKESFEDAVKRLPAKDVVEIRKWDGSVKEIAGLRHKDFAKVLRFITARTSNGYPVPLWLWGAPGAGKTKLGSQLAEALGIPFYPVPLGPTSTESKLIGYKNLANGAYVEGHLYKPFGNGGLAMLDEIDIADPGVLVVLNSLIANDIYCFPNGELIKRHPDFHVTACANTIGKGATGGFTRNKLDAATLDRFVKMRLEYDRDLESALCGNAKWCDYVWKVREYVQKNCNDSIYITPRASMNGSALLNNGVESKDVVETVLLAMCSEDVKKTITLNCGEFQP